MTAVSSLSPSVAVIESLIDEIDYIARPFKL